MRIFIGFFFSFFLFLGCGIPSKTTFSLPSLFSDNMVLQRNATVQFWGTSVPKSEVSISTPWGVFSEAADSSGAWQIGFPTPNESPSFNVDICTKNECIKINNIVLGEVWLASGQSNMEMPLKGWPPSDPILNSEEEIEQAGNYELRFFAVERDLSNIPLDDVRGKWMISDSISAANFSATAYFFAKELYKEFNVPIGIIDSSWGGTPVESWTGMNSLQQTELYDDTLENFSGFDSRLNDFEEWLAPLMYFPMPGAASTHLDWKELPFNDIEYANEAYDDSDWFNIELPGSYNDVFGDTKVNDFDGIVWIRKTFYLNDLDDAYFLDLGLVDDMDFTYINGVFVGGKFQAESFREKQYKIPEGLLKLGKNVISIRLIDTMGAARVGKPISIKSSNNTINLAGSWKAIPSAELYNNNFYRLDADYVKSSKRPDFIKVTPFTPTVLYNAMIHPLIPYTIKGAIWYQGESNVGFADEYETTFQAMIAGWRSQWGYEFPFYFVQIAPYDYANGLSAALRNAQFKSTATVNTGIVSTLDLGNATNIHPANKMDVGKRLANLALGNNYGIDGRLRASKPTSIIRTGNNLEVRFDCQDGGRVSVKPNTNEIEISADNITYHPAKVVADGCSIRISSPKVRNPKYVRHAWSDTSTGSIVNEQNEAICAFLLNVE